MKFIFLKPYLLIGLGALLFCIPIKAQNMKTIAKNGMTVSWFVENNRVHFSITAPTTGWVAIGLNTKDQLAGTNLIMGAVSNDQVQISDRYIIRPGKHEAVSSLGGKSALADQAGNEEDGMTRLRFSLPLNARDTYHQKLEAGQSYSLLIAYSVSDDFQHHSRMRSSVQIIL